MNKLEIVRELKRLDPSLEAAQGRRLLTLRAYTLREILRQQKEWARRSVDAITYARGSYFEDETAAPRVKKGAGSRAKKVADPRVKKGGASPFWRHRTKDGTPILPWEKEIGPGLEFEGDSIMDEVNYFAEEEYTYEDFDTDWGGYEYEDTGYPDEDS